MKKLRMISCFIILIPVLVAYILLYCGVYAVIYLIYLIMEGLTWIKNQNSRY